MSINDEYYLSQGLFFGNWQKLSDEDKVEKTKQLILNMLDWVQQSDIEDIYLKLYNCFEE